METILFEDKSLIEIYDMLVESRGVIDGIEPMVASLANGINDNIGNKEFFVGRNEKEAVSIYSMSFVCDSSRMDTSFMIDPMFGVDVFVMDNKFGDVYRSLGENCYYSPMIPKVSFVDGKPKLREAKFHLSFIVPFGGKLSFEDAASKMSHEIVHARKNFEEFVSASKKRYSSRERDVRSLELMSSNEKDSLRSLVGRILYLCSRDEINARSNQLYYELKRFGHLNRRNVNELVRNTSVYSFVEEMERYIGKVSELESIGNVAVEDEVRWLLNDVYGKINSKMREPLQFLENLLIKRKNDFIRQIDKVKERCLCEKMNETIKMV